MGILPLINPPSNDKWIEYIGKYMINMGAVEAATRVIIAKLNGTDKIEIYSDDLTPRVKYLRARYPNSNLEKYQKAMRTFDIIEKHIIFRNIVAHSSVVHGDSPSGEKIVIGLMNLKPKDTNNIAEIISIEEIKGRVDEAAAIGNFLLEYQDEFKKDRTFQKVERSEN